MRILEVKVYQMLFDFDYVHPKISLISNSDQQSIEFIPHQRTLPTNLHLYRHIN
jgi:hypothetical protein